MPDIPKKMSKQKPAKWFQDFVDSIPKQRLKTPKGVPQGEDKRKNDD